MNTASDDLAPDARPDRAWMSVKIYEKRRYKLRGHKQNVADARSGLLTSINLGRDFHMQDDWIKEVLCDCAEWARLHGLTQLENALRDSKRIADQTLSSAPAIRETASD